MDSTFTKSQILGLFAFFFVLVLAVQWYAVRWFFPKPLESSIISSTVSTQKVIPVPLHEAKIVNVSSNMIGITFSQNPSAALPSTPSLQLNISQNTKIEEGNSKAPTERASLMQDYIGKYSQGMNPLFPELFTSTKQISISSLKPGDDIIFFLLGDKIDPVSKTALATRIIRIHK